MLCARKDKSSPELNLRMSQVSYISIRFVYAMGWCVCNKNKKNGLVWIADSASIFVQWTHMQMNSMQKSVCLVFAWQCMRFGWKNFQHVIIIRVRTYIRETQVHCLCYGRIVYFLTYMRL